MKFLYCLLFLSFVGIQALSLAGGDDEREEYYMEQLDRRRNRRPHSNRENYRPLGEKPRKVPIDGIPRRRRDYKDPYVELDNSYKELKVGVQDPNSQVVLDSPTSALVDTVSQASIPVKLSDQIAK